MGNPVGLITDLLRLGARLELKGGVLHLEGPEESEPLVRKVTENKAEIAAFLRGLQEKTGRPYITCYLCSRFRPAINSPNPREALGRCLHRNATRYGLQKPCRHFTFKEDLCATDNTPHTHATEPPLQQPLQQSNCSESQGKQVTIALLHGDQGGGLKKKNLLEDGYWESLLGSELPPEAMSEEEGGIPL